MPTKADLVHGRLSTYIKHWCRCGECREANAEQQRRWKARNPGKRYPRSEAAKVKARARERQWRKANPDKVRAQSRAWALANPEKCRRSSAQWALKNRAKGREYAARRRALKRGAECRTVTQRDLMGLLRIHGGLCVYCKTAPFEVWDHVVPLARGGRHAIGNLAPACAKCNRSKWSKWLAQWRREAATGGLRAA